MPGPSCSCLFFCSFSRCMWPGCRRYSGSEVLLFYFSTSPGRRSLVHYVIFFTSFFVTCRCCYYFSLCISFLVHVGDRTSVFYTQCLYYIQHGGRLVVAILNRVSTSNARRFACEVWIYERRAAWLKELWHCFFLCPNSQATRLFQIIDPSRHRRPSHKRLYLLH